MELRAKNVRNSKEKRCKLGNKEEALQKELQEIDFKMCNGDFLTRILWKNLKLPKKN